VLRHTEYRVFTEVRPVDEFRAEESGSLLSSISKQSPTRRHQSAETFI